MTPTATPPMAHTPTIPNISKDIYPSGGKPAQAQAPTPAKKQKTPKQGTRVPEDFMPAQKHIDKIRSMAPHLNLELEHQKFMNFWLSKTRENTKLDWGRAWENWMLKAIERTSYEPGHIRRGRYYAQANQAYAQAPSPQEPAGAGASAEEFLRSIE